MAAYYNEIDPFAAAWLRELIVEGLIAPGEVDERSIEDVYPDDLKGFVQCHFFAGIGIWSLALRRAGWEDSRPIWTGSCPCQPFSAAGKGAGIDDERHLWPAFEWLIRSAKPRAVPVAGEQVASKDGLAWLDIVSADMERAGHALGSLDTCAAGFSAPHIRQRLYWLGYAFGEGLEGHAGNVSRSGGRSDPPRSASASSGACGVADADGARHIGTERGAEGEARDEARLRLPSALVDAGGLADAHDEGEGRRGICGSGEGDSAGSGTACERSSGLCPDGGLVPGDPADGLANSASGIAGDGKLRSRRQHGQLQKDASDSANGGVSLHPLNYWGAADWLLCRDPDGPRFRPVEPGSFPLVDAGALCNRLVEVRGAGNAINLAQAQGFIEAAMECMP